eukprot:96735_1
MGNIVEQLAFIPPDRPEAHEQMKIENKGNLKIVKNSIGNNVALLWFDFDAEYTILYSHGNAEDLAGSKTTFLDLATYLECNFCAYDYSGYGLSEGQCSEKACFADIHRVFEFLTLEQKVPASKIIVFGRSLGSGPTIHLASQHTDLAGMVLQSPLKTAIKTQMPDWIGFVFKKIDIFTNEDKVPKIKHFPVLIIHGTTDNVVPYAHGKHLYSLLKKENHNPNCVELYSVEGCGHNDIEYRKGREFKKKLKSFIKIQIQKKPNDATNYQEHKMDDVYIENANEMHQNDPLKYFQTAMNNLNEIENGSDPNLSEYNAPAINDIYNNQPQ